MAPRFHSILKGASLLVVAVQLTTAGCDRGGPRRSWAAGGHKDKNNEPLPVTVAKLAPADIARHYDASGTLAALQSAQIVALQPGIIKEITIEEGDAVKRDQVLAKLDGRELKLQAAAASLQVENLERELTRLNALAGTAVSQEELDKQRYAVEEARASAQLSSHQAKQMLIRAPFAGTVTRRHVDVGNLASTATPLFDIADLSALELDLHLPEREAAGVRVEAKVQLALLDKTTFEGTVVRRSPVVDALTGTVKFTIRADRPPPAAIPGAFTRARVLVENRPGVPSLPSTAIFELEGTPHVYVIEDGKARRRSVALGIDDGERVEVLSGVSETDSVIAQASGGLNEGQAVKPLDSAETPPNRPVRSGS